MIKDSVEAEFIKRVRYRPWLVVSILLAADLISIAFSFYFSAFIRVQLIPLVGGVLDYASIFPQFLLATILIISLFALNGLYHCIGKTGISESKQVFKITTIAFISLGLAIFILRTNVNFSRLVFLSTWLLCMMSIAIIRSAIHNRGSLQSWWSQPAVVIGKRVDIERVVMFLFRSRRMAIKPVVGLAIDNGFEKSQIAGIPIYNYSVEMQKKVRDCGIDLVVYTDPTSSMKNEGNNILYTLSLTFSNLIYVVGESSLNSLSMKVYDLEGLPALKVEYNLLNPFSLALKRAVDLFFSLIVSVLVLPFFALFVLIIKLDSPGPIIYKQERMGKNGKVFNLYKFRTMFLDSENKLKELLANDDSLRSEYEYYHKLKKDPRVTSFGRFLRKTSLDELPQIINIFKGEMSWVGPRAYMPEERENMGNSADLILRVAPGLTGWWQVMGRHEVTFTERLRLDEYYISNFSLWIDFYVIMKTVWIVITGKGA